MDNDFPVTSFICFLFGIIIFCGCLSYTTGQKSVRKEAVENGYGVYEADTVGDTTFRWLTPKEISAKRSEETKKTETDTAKKEKE